MNTHNSYSTSSIRSIPSTLIPIINVTSEYAKRTYAYATLFDKERFSTCMHNEDDDLINSWRAVLSKLQDQLRQQGLESGKQAAVAIMREYKVFLPTTNHLPVSFIDVIKIISNPTWYNSHLERNRTICHMIMYGLFRHGMNTWLHDLCNVWKTKYNIKEEQDVSIKRHGKGSVWLNLQKRAMHSIQHIVRTAMLNVHGEYISCRDRKGKAKKSMISKPIQCNAFNAFLFMKRSRPSVQTTSTDLSKNVQCLLESGQSPETVRYNVETAIGLFDSRDMEPHGMCMHLL